MLMIKNADFSPESSVKTAVTVGKFDGLHRGHRELIRRVAEKKKDGLVPLVYAIDMNAYTGDKALLTEAEECEILESAGVELLIRVPFSKEFASVNAEDFVTEVLIKQLHASAVVSGEDFCFGAGRRGNAALLTNMQQDCGYDYECVPRVFYGNEPVSSTRIRNCLAEGRIEEANYCLGEAYTLSGTVIHGMHLASALGFPTANIRPDPEKKLPLFGVYRVSAVISGTRYRGMANIGVKPTVGGLREPLLEVYFPDFSGDLYGAGLNVEFVSFLRPEKKFDTLEALKEQISKDIARI